MATELPTQPGWTPPPRRRVSDRVLISIIGAIVALLEGWRTIGPMVAPPAQAAVETVSPERFGRLEEKVGKMSDSMIEVRIKLKLDPRP